MGLLTLFPGRVGGSETYVRGLLGAFAAGDGPERVTVLANRHVLAPYAPLARGPVRLHHVASYRPGDRDITRLAAMTAARVAPGRVARDVPGDLDVVHFPLTVPIPRTDQPTVTTIHDVQHHELPGFFSAAERRFRAWAYDDAARRARLIVTPSEHARAGLVRHVGVERERIVVIPHGIDHERFHPAPRAPSVVDLPPRFVVYPANLWPHKNHERLVEALAHVEDRGLALVLTGQTYGRLDGLMALARRLGVAGRVRHLGFVAADVVPELYRSAVAAVFPSLFEGFGFPALEAMACGCPVAASSAGALAEVCGDAAVSFDARDLVAIAAAIDALAADAALRERLRAAGLARASGYTWGAAAHAHAASYARAYDG